MENAQPIFYNYSKGTLALAHNGNITNAEELRRSLQEEGAVFNGTSDSEVLAYAVAKERINSARNLIKAGVASLDALKASGIYTPQEIEAIMAP